MVSVISRGAFSAKSDAEKVKFLQANPDVKVLTPQGLVNPIVNATGNQNDWQEASLVTAGGTTTVFGGAASELRLNPNQ